MLLLAEAVVIFGAIVVAVYARLGAEEGLAELMLRQGLLKAGFATVFSLTTTAASWCCGWCRRWGWPGLLWRSRFTCFRG